MAKGFIKGKPWDSDRCTFDELTREQQKHALTVYRSETGKDSTESDDEIIDVFSGFDWDKSTGKPWINRGI